MAWAEMWDSQWRNHIHYSVVCSFRSATPNTKLSFGIVPQSRTQFFLPLLASVWLSTPLLMERWPLETQQGLFSLNKSWKSEKHTVCVREKDPKLKLWSTESCFIPLSSHKPLPVRVNKPCLMNFHGQWSFLMRVNCCSTAIFQELVVMLAFTNENVCSVVLAISLSINSQLIRVLIKSRCREHGMIQCWNYKEQRYLVV